MARYEFNGIGWRFSSILHTVWVNIYSCSGLCQHFMCSPVSGLVFFCVHYQGIKHSLFLLLDLVWVTRHTNGRSWQIFHSLGWHLDWACDKILKRSQRNSVEQTLLQMLCEDMVFGVTHLWGALSCVLRPQTTSKVNHNFHSWTKSCKHIFLFINQLQFQNIHHTCTCTCTKSSKAEYYRHWELAGLVGLGLRIICNSMHLLGRLRKHTKRDEYESDRSHSWSTRDEKKRG